MNLNDELRNRLSGIVYIPSGWIMDEILDTIIETLEDYGDLKLCEERLANSTGVTYSLEEVMEALKITAADLEDLEDEEKMAGHTKWEDVKKKRAQMDLADKQHGLVLDAYKALGALSESLTEVTEANVALRDELQVTEGCMEANGDLSLQWAKKYGKAETAIRQILALCLAAELGHNPISAFRPMVNVDSIRTVLGAYSIIMETE